MYNKKSAFKKYIWTAVFVFSYVAMVFLLLPAWFDFMILIFHLQNLLNSQQHALKNKSKKVMKKS